MCRRQQLKEQFCLSEAMDPRALDCRVMLACSYEALPPSPGSLWSAVMPRLPRTSSAQSVPYSDVKDMDKGCQITNALQGHTLAFNQMTLIQGNVDPSNLGCLEPFTSPCDMSGTCPSSSSLRNSSRLACVLAPTFMENPEQANTAVSQHYDSVKEQCQSGKTGLDVQVAFVDYYP